MLIFNTGLLLFPERTIIFQTLARQLTRHDILQAIHFLLERQQFNGITEFISVNGLWNQSGERTSECKLSLALCGSCFFVSAVKDQTYQDVFILYTVYKGNIKCEKRKKKTMFWQKMMRKIPCIFSNVLRHLLSVVSYICFSSLVCCYGTLADSGWDLDYLK